MCGKRWSGNCEAGWLALEPGSLDPQKETQCPEGSEEGGKLPSGETTLGFLAQEACSQLCEGDARRAFRWEMAGPEAEKQKTHQKGLGFGQAFGTSNSEQLLRD